MRRTTRCARRWRAELAADGAFLARLVSDAPSVAVARHLWRLLDGLCQPAEGAPGGVAVTTFAIPVIIVAGVEGTTSGGTLPAILPESRRP